MDNNGDDPGRADESTTAQFIELIAKADGARLGAPGGVGTEDDPENPRVRERVDILSALGNIAAHL